MYKLLPVEPTRTDSKFSKFLCEGNDVTILLPREVQLQDLNATGRRVGGGGGGGVGATQAATAAVEYHVVSPLAFPTDAIMHN